MGYPTTDREYVSDVLFIFPVDSSSGKKRYPIKEYYKDGAIKLIGVSRTSSYIPRLEGPSITYYPNGHKKSYDNYKDGQLIGEETLFYPNGKFNSTENFTIEKELLITCKDSLGNILAEGGNGRWIKINYINDKKVISDGMVKDSLQEGEWHEKINDTGNYVTIYKKGLAIKSTDPDQIIGEHIYTLFDRNPIFPQGGPAGFDVFLKYYIKYPDYAIKRSIQGIVWVTFVVEKDGSLTNIKAIKYPDESLANELIRVMKNSPRWRPGMQYDRLVRGWSITSFQFNIPDDKKN